MVEGFHDILILLSFLIEVAVLFYMEMKAWKTLYTPLNFLMLPYVVVLLITVAISGKLGFVEFYYPSILLWSVGLVVFACPSLVLGYLTQKHNFKLCPSIKEEEISKVVAYLSFVLILLFLWRLKSMLGGPYAIGSEEFGEEFCGAGLWGHLRQLLMPLLIMAIYFVDNKHKWLWLIIIPILVFTLLYLVKGWVIIPCLAGMAMRLYVGKTKFRVSLILYVVLGAFLVFLGSYILILAVSRERELNNEILTFIFGHFVHYFTSGTLGLSCDALANFPDTGTFDNLWIPIINIINVLTGENDMMSPINSYFYYTGTSATNVRTYFGTIYIYSNCIEFIVYLLLSSTLMYSLRLAIQKWNNVYVCSVYFFECALLAMGWFEFYHFHLAAFEVPAMALILWGVDWVCRGRYMQSLNRA